MTQMDSLFDAEPYRVEAAPKTTRPKDRVPVSGIRWRRTGLKRDCAACWRQQHAEYDPNRPLYTVRQPAVAELQIWDDDGALSHHEWYCKSHAENLGWDGSRSYDRRKRRDIEAEAKTVWAFKLNRLTQDAKSGRRRSGFDDDVSNLIRAAGGGGLEMPEWTVTAGGLLTGRFHAHAARAVRDWAEQWNGEVESEPVTRFERLVATSCRIIDSPAVTVRVCGYTHDQ